MNKEIKTICVFASASDNIDKIYFQAAHELGKTIEEKTCAQNIKEEAINTLQKI